LIVCLDGLSCFLVFSTFLSFLVVVLNSYFFPSSFSLITGWFSPPLPSQTATARSSDFPCPRGFVLPCLCRSKEQRNDSPPPPLFCLGLALRLNRGGRESNSSSGVTLQSGPFFCYGEKSSHPDSALNWRSPSSSIQLILELFISPTWCGGGTCQVNLSRFLSRWVA